MLKYLLLFAAAGVVSLLVTPLVRAFARRVRAMDLPEGRKIHSKPTPRLGGIAIFVAFYLVLLVAS